MKTQTKKTEIEFDAGALVARVEAFAAGREPSRERMVKLPPPVRAIPARQIRAGGEGRQAGSVWLPS
jgi:hypothetical protein